MSYMNHNESFTPVGGIQEMSSDEIDAVAGGPVSTSTVLGVGAAICAGAALVLAAPAIVAVTGTAAAVYGATAAVLALGAAGAALVEK